MSGIKKVRWGMSERLSCDGCGVRLGDGAHYSPRGQFCPPCHARDMVMELTYLRAENQRLMEALDSIQGSYRVAENLRDIARNALDP